MGVSPNSGGAGGATSPASCANLDGRCSDPSRISPCRPRCNADATGIPLPDAPEQLGAFQQAFGIASTLLLLDLLFSTQQRWLTCCSLKQRWLKSALCWQ